MVKEDIKFQIDQLRKDKIIYATEATATNVICLLVYLFVRSELSGQASSIVAIGAIVIAVGYTIYMGVGNFKRLQKINSLEKKLLN